jgi:sugar phosphate isomerase/epimerase
MKLKLVRHLWGMNTPLELAFPLFRQQGYQAIEGHPPHDQQERVRSLREASGLGLIGMAFTGGDSIDQHFDSLRQQVDNLLAQGAYQITVHSGSDAWPVAKAVEFLGRVNEYEQGLPVAVGHETHRGRILFNPWVTRDLLRQLPNLKLVIDFSHFVCVAERLNWDDGGIVDLCAQRCVHLHARVGYEEGPQVPDPSAAEYAGHLAKHVEWWKVVWNARKRMGDASLSVTPEFGPPGYLHTLPHTNVPVADLAKIVEWMSARLRSELAD